MLTGHLKGHVEEARAVEVRKAARSLVTLQFVGALAYSQRVLDQWSYFGQFPLSHIALLAQLKLLQGVHLSKGSERFAHRNVDCQVR